MNKKEFLTMMVQDNETRTDKKAIMAEVIDTMELALSQSPDSVQIDPSKTAEGAYALIEAEGRKTRAVGPFRAAEIIAGYLGVKFERAVKKYGTAAPTVKLEDFF